MVDICQQCHTLRSASHRGHMAHLGLCSCSTPEKLSGLVQAVDMMHGPPGTVHSPSNRSPEFLDLGRTQNTQSIQVCPLVEDPIPEWLRPGKCMKQSSHLGQCPCRAAWSLSSVDPGSTCNLGLWQTQCGPSTASTPTHPSGISLQCLCFPTTQLNK